MRGLSVPLTLLVVAVALSDAARAEPLVIRNSYVVPVSNWEPLLVAKKDLAKHWGKSYVMEAVRYQGTPPMITALANGELEIANLAYSTLGIAIQNAGISDLRVISDEFRDGVPGYFSNQFFVRKDYRHQEDRGPQGQGARHQCDRRRRRHRHEGRPEEARPDRQARLHRASKRRSRPCRRCSTTRRPTWSRR